MAKKEVVKTLYIDLNAGKEGVFSRYLSKRAKRDYDPQDIELLRKLFSNQKTRILYVIRNDNPKSIYDLAKILKRDFKSVYQDLKFLERFGFVDFHSEKIGKRESLKPCIGASTINISLSV